MNLLRNLARACLALLKQIKQMGNPPIFTSSRKIHESSCWIVIALVADNWKQRDLWTDAEDTLRYLQVSWKVADVFIVNIFQICLQGKKAYMLDISENILSLQTSIS